MFRCRVPDATGRTTSQYRHANEKREQELCFKRRTRCDQSWPVYVLECCRRDVYSKEPDARLGAEKATVNYAVVITTRDEVGTDRSTHC